MMTVCPVVAGSGITFREERNKESAIARSAAYGLFSRLTASPDHLATDPDHFLPADLPYALEEVEEALPYEIDFYALAKAEERLTGEGFTALKGEYARLFEAGTGGTPVPIREGSARNSFFDGDWEELISFYDFFGYDPHDEFRWQPDHLSAQLEFMQCLTYLEGQSADPNEALACQVAQYDFLQQHLSGWYRQVQEGVRANTSSDFYQRLFEALGGFLRADLAWQREMLDFAPAAGG
ncbi:MAG TPA: molecular chaperone TorD family protein [Blastocatellia bacterium]|nr:molecular chaperone TorD family protein [Blastocatellia bacterium]